MRHALTISATAISAVCILVLAASCKPADEPAYPWTTPPETYPFTQTDSPAPLPGPLPALTPEPVPEPVLPPPTPPPPEPIPAADDKPLDPKPLDSLPAEPVAADNAQSWLPTKPVDSPADLAVVPPVIGMPTLHPAVQAALQRKATRKQKLEARRLNSEGLHRHKKGDYGQAAEKYRDALAVDGRARFPRYNLACALALLGKSDEALQHLLALRELGHEAKLADARVDADFVSMRADARFVALSGLATVQLLRGRRATSEGVQRMVGVVRDRGRYEAVVGGASSVSAEFAWPKSGTVYFGPDHADSAAALADALGLLAEPRPAELTSGTDLVVVLAKDAEVARAAGRALERFYDRKLHGRSSRGEHMLHLKATGFFTERIYREDDESTIKRNGTFTVEGDDLVRTYRETRETEEQVDGPDERSDRVSFEVRDTRLVVDGVTLKP